MANEMGWLFAATTFLAKHARHVTVLGNCTHWVIHQVLRKVDVDN